jgi:hypothetical protein
VIPGPLTEVIELPKADLHVSGKHLIEHLNARSFPQEVFRGELAVAQIYARVNNGLIEKSLPFLSLSSKPYSQQAAASTSAMGFDEPCGT